MAGLEGLINTILQLRELDLRRRSTEVAERAGLFQERATNQKILSDFLESARQTKDPAAFLQQVPEVSRQTGFSPEFLTTLLHGTAPTTATTKDIATAAGASQVPVGEVASANLAGKTQGELALSNFVSALYGGVTPTESQKSGAAERMATGRTPGQAAKERAFMALPAAEQQQQAGIEGQTRIGEADKVKLAQGWKALEIQMAQLGLQAMGDKQDPSLEIMKNMQQNFDELQAPGTTLTKEGWRQRALLHNAYTAQLRLLHPDMPLADLDPEHPAQWLRAQSGLEFMMQNGKPSGPGNTMPITSGAPAGPAGAFNLFTGQLFR